jgi:hypothetical protein
MSILYFSLHAIDLTLPKYKFVLRHREQAHFGSLYNKRKLVRSFFRLIMENVDFWHQRGN